MKLKTIIAVLLAASVAVGLSACGAKSGDAVYAQSMRSLNDVGAVGVADRFAGMAVAGRTKEIKKDPALTVEEIRVGLQPVEKAVKGDSFSIKTGTKIRPSDKLFLWKKVQPTTQVQHPIQ